MTAFVSQQILNVVYTTNQPLRVTSMAVEVLRTTATSAGASSVNKNHMTIIAS